MVCVLAHLPGGCDIREFDASVYRTYDESSCNDSREKAEELVGTCRGKKTPVLQRDLK